MEYTISQAMRYAAQLKAKLSEVKKRAASSLNHKKDAEPPFEFAKMMTEYHELMNTLCKVKGALAVANATTTITCHGGELTLAAVIGTLQELKGYIAFIKELPCMAAKETISSDRNWDEATDKYLTQQVVTVCHLTEAGRAHLIDTMQAQFDELNWLVESKNQVTKLVID